MKRAIRILSIVAGSLFGLVLVAATTVYFLSERRINGKLPMGDEPIPVPTDSASIATGRHLGEAITKCAECHGPDLGGQVVVENGAMGRWVSANLTRGKGGRGAELTDADIIRAMRHGVARDGRKLMLMPSVEYSYLTAEDVGAIVAWVRSVRPVDRELPARRFGPVARALLAANKFPIFEAERVEHTRVPSLAPPPGPTVDYGRYIARTGGCMGCHGETLAGGKILAGDPAWPPAANLTGLGPRYDEAKFTRALREGVRPEGTPINPAMPFRWTKLMTDDEIRAVWLFLQSLPAREFGAR